MHLEQRLAHEREGWSGGVRAEHGRLRARFHHVFSCPNSRSADQQWQRVADWLVPGSAVLEIGASTGTSAAEHMARRPRRFVGIDLMPEFVEAARQAAPGAEFFARDAHNTGFADGEFDVVTGRAILHHLDFEKGLREVHRVLRPGGAAFFLEPLRDNPAAKVIRSMTPRARTADELPLSREQIEWADGLFGSQQHMFFGLVSTGVGLLTSLTDLASDNAALRWADQVDRRLATSSIRYWMRFALLVWQKRAKTSAPGR